MRFTKYGRRELAIFGAAAAALMLIVLVATIQLLHFRLDLALLVSLPFIVLFILVLAFFRDPKRVPPRGEHRIVSPADGTVYDIGEVEENDFIGGPCTRIGIFISIFDCHINRAPCSGTVEKIIYKRGRFHSAWTKAKECSKANESNFVGLGNAAGRDLRIGIKQIAGQIARRIVCELKEGDAVQRGQPFGMIKFGSRTELFIPTSANLNLRVKLGAPVKAGRTIIGTLETPKDAANAEGQPQEEAEENDEAVLEPLDVNDQPEPDAAIEGPSAPESPEPEPQPKPPSTPEGEQPDDL